MTVVIGGPGAGLTANLGAYRARDGSRGAPVVLDVDRPHAAVIVGKRGYGKSYTLGVLIEELAETDAIAPVVVDPVGSFRSLAESTIPAEVLTRPQATATSIPPRSWPDLFDLDPTDPAGSLLWTAAGNAETLAGMAEWVADADVQASLERAVRNHLDLARRWDVFDPEGLATGDLLDGTVTVLDTGGMGHTATNIVVRAVADALYTRCVRQRPDRLPWLLVDEAHVAFDGVAAPALQRLFTRGRRPGVSLVCATQRPAALPPVACSQADLLVSHRLTSRPDLAALEDARPTYVADSLESRLPAEPGEALVIDDRTEAVHAVRIRERRTEHGGGSPRLSDGAGSRRAADPS